MTQPDDLDREIAEAVPDYEITTGQMGIDLSAYRARVRALVERERIYAHKLTEEEVAAYEARGAAKALRHGAGRAMERCGADLKIVCPHCQGIARELNARADALEKGEGK